MQLRQLGIYQLPNGRVLIAEGRLLFVYGDNNESQTDSYEVDENGRLVSNGKDTAWAVSDLLDTGVTAPRFILQQ